jgi:SAM-dependent methyltransferase
MKETYYQDHWLSIEPERLQRYESMFQWREQQAPMLEPLQLQAGMVALDYGCGPGFISLEMARRVGDAGFVHALDINRQFVTRARQRAEDSGQRNIRYQLIDDGGSGVDDQSVDRVFCKNVLEYVPDVAHTLESLRRCMKPGAKIQLIDSDWGFVIVEPWGPKRTAEFFAAAAPAFKEPNIGRKLLGFLRDAGFDDITVSVSASADARGGSLAVLTNMRSYIDTFASLDADLLDRMMAELTEAVESGRFLFVLPQFTVTATNPG